MERTHPSWQDALTLELRLHDWNGAQIGEVLAEVGTHCMESGESPEDAFGDGTAYARRLVAARPAHAVVEDSGPMVALGLVSGLIGLFLVPYAAGGLFERADVELSLGALIVLLLAVSGGIVLHARPTAVLRGIVRRRFITVLLIMCATTLVFSGLLDAFSVAIATLPWPVVAGGASLALTASVVGLWATTRGGDPVTDPTTGRSGQPGLMLQGVAAFLFPIAAAVMVGVQYLLTLG